MEWERIIDLKDIPFLKQFSLNVGVLSTYAWVVPLKNILSLGAR